MMLAHLQIRKTNLRTIIDCDECFDGFSLQTSNKMEFVNQNVFLFFIEQIT